MKHSSQVNLCSEDTVHPPPLPHLVYFELKGLETMCTRKSEEEAVLDIETNVWGHRIVNTNPETRYTNPKTATCICTN